MSMLSMVLGFSLLYAADLYGEHYPAAQGFDTAGSSPQAIALAEKTMQAMGGYSAWSQTRFITWRFFMLVLYPAWWRLLSRALCTSPPCKAYRAG